MLLGPYLGYWVMIELCGLLLTLCSIGCISGCWVLTGLLVSYWVSGFLCCCLGPYCVSGFLLGDRFLILGVWVLIWLFGSLCVYWVIKFVLGCWVIGFLLVYWVRIWLLGCWVLIGLMAYWPIVGLFRYCVSIGLLVSYCVIGFVCCDWVLIW